MKIEIEKEIDFDFGDIKLNDDMIFGALNKLAIKYFEIVMDSISKGIDSDGDNFAPYSSAYARRKERAGRTEWLTVTRKMLRSMHPKYEKGRNEWSMVVDFVGMHPKVSFTARKRAVKGTKTGKRIELTIKETPSNIPNALLAEVNDKTRPFIGISDSNVEVLKQLFENYILQAEII